MADVCYPKYDVTLGAQIWGLGAWVRPTAALGHRKIDLQVSPSGYLATQRITSLGLHKEWKNPYR